MSTIIVFSTQNRYTEIKYFPRRHASHDSAYSGKYFNDFMINKENEYAYYSRLSFTFFLLR